MGSLQFLSYPAAQSITFFVFNLFYFLFTSSQTVWFFFSLSIVCSIQDNPSFQFSLCLCSTIFAVRSLTFSLNCLVAYCLHNGICECCNSRKKEKKTVKNSLAHTVSPPPVRLNDKSTEQVWLKLPSSALIRGTTLTLQSSVVASFMIMLEYNPKAQFVCKSDFCPWIPQTISIISYIYIYYIMDLLYTCDAYVGGFNEVWNKVNYFVI